MLTARYKHVVFHCSSSQGRGPRCAGWYQDALEDKGITGSGSYVLAGGIKAWLEAYPDEIVRI
jgi:arsenical-resistance protein 2